MPYDDRDPRSQLATAPPPARAGGVCRSAQYFEFRSWSPTTTTCRRLADLVRAQPELLRRLLARATRRRAESRRPARRVHGPAAARLGCRRHGRRASSRQVAGGSVVVVPPAPALWPSRRPVSWSRVFSTTRRRPHRPLPQRRRVRRGRRQRHAVPALAGGRRRASIRVYALADTRPSPARFGRILRCRTIMVNYFEPDDGPRDPSRLSPHHHDDFEQLSLQLDGDYVHHMRTPWTVNLDDWRDDEHRRCSSPAITIIPPAAGAHEPEHRPDAPPARRHLLPARGSTSPSGRAGCATPTTTRCRSVDPPAPRAGRPPSLTTAASTSSPGRSATPGAPSRRACWAPAAGFEP